jgi:hypothetical protein
MRLRPVDGGRRRRLTKDPCAGACPRRFKAALLLQAFLGFATPAHAFGSPGAVLCAEHASGAPEDGPAPLHAHPCCTLVQVTGVALPASEPVAVAWPFAPSLRLVWRAEAAHPKTGPPLTATSARGPPAA